MVRDVHIVRIVVGHGPDHAELIAQVVPKPASAEILLNPPVESLGCLGCDVTRIDVESLQYGLAGLGQLLDGVHDDHLILDVQVLQQGLVGQLVNARLVAAQIDRHPIGRFVVQGLPQPIAGGHCLAVSGSCGHSGRLSAPICHYFWRPFKVVAIALANKMARIIPALLTKGGTYRNTGPANGAANTSTE